MKMQQRRKSLQVFVQSPDLHQIRHESVTGDETLSDLKRSLFPESHNLSSSFYFTLHGKPLPDDTPLSTSRIAPLSTLVLWSRLRGGDADGSDCYLNIYPEKKPDKVDPSNQSVAKENTRNTDASSTISSCYKEAENIDESESVRTKRRKVETAEKTEGSTLEEFVHYLEASVENVCTHPGTFGGMCIRCGKKLNSKSGITFRYIHKGLRLHHEEISRLQSKDTKNLLCRKKLYLVLDLDHTLLNSTRLDRLSSEELHLLTQTDSPGSSDISNGSLFKLECLHRMTKLRPFVRTFLKEASEMFEMYIYTMGSRFYALEMAKLLDPQGEYFNAKVISRDDGTQKHEKGLDVVLGQESAILILDDTALVWRKHAGNLILIDRYHFFASDLRHFGFKCKSLAELKHDENETDGALARILNVLKHVHFTFFDKLEENPVDRDVRKILSSVRSEVLSGCVIVFCSFSRPPLPALRWIAQQMGATCLRELDPSVTHVVSTDGSTDKSQWAVKENKFLVLPRWIEAAYFLWQKQPEGNFVCK